jgi:hypothetical protein
VYFHDCGASVVRPKCLEKIEENLLPQKWMGKKIYPLIKEFKMLIMSMNCLMLNIGC